MTWKICLTEAVIGAKLNLDLSAKMASTGRFGDT
jgi:hypothetical protein